MNFSPDLATVTHGIQLAVAPVFFLTAVSGMIAAVAGRLARIIDRARSLENRLEEGHVESKKAIKMYAELKALRKRGWLVNNSLALLTFCAMFIGLTIILLFLGETAEFQIPRIATISFLSGVVCFISALVCFLAETVLATRLLRFARMPELAAVTPPNDASIKRDSRL
jgi:predicted MFS family arabinose efflux permease